jgi:hypothetical protein
VNTNLYIIIGVVLVLLVVVVLSLVLSSRSRRSARLKDKFGPEYDHAVEASGEKDAQKELEERQKHVSTLNIQPLSPGDRGRYLIEWANVQSKFVDEPGQAIGTAERLINEVMKMRGYPEADFEQRASELSVNYPTLVSNYRAARAIAIKNEQQQANTEELRQALIYYRSLFDELVLSDTVPA